MTSDIRDTETAAASNSGPLTEGQFRLLRLAVYGMGVLLVVGFLVIIGRIIYLMAQSPPTPASPVAEAGTPKGDIRLALPSGAAIKHVSLAGNRLAVHYDAPAGSGIVLLDLASGAVVSRIAITSDTGR